MFSIFVPAEMWTKKLPKRTIFDLKDKDIMSKRQNSMRITMTYGTYTLKKLNTNQRQGSV